MRRSLVISAAPRVRAVATINSSGGHGPPGSRSANHPTEFDAAPRSSPTLWNVATIGARNDSRGVFVGNGSEGILFNAIVANFAGDCWGVDDANESRIPTLVRIDHAILSGCGSDNMTYSVDPDDLAGLVDTRFVEPMLERPDMGTMPDFRPTEPSPALTGALPPPAPFDATGTFIGAFGGDDWTLPWASYPVD